MEDIPADQKTMGATETKEPEQQPEEAQAEEVTAASAAPTLEENADPFHIGNTLTIVSDQHGLTVGKVVYRDANLLRIMPMEASDRAIDFPLTGGDGMEFAPETGVTEVELIERQASDYYVDFLGARPGEALEFFTVDGKEAAPSGVVAEIVKTATKDSIRLEDGRTLRFRGVGPEPPIAVIRVRTAANLAAEASAAAAPGAEDAAAVATAAAARQRDLMDLLFSVLPTAQVEIIPTAERSYPDSLQREDLFQDLMSSLTEKQRTNPRRIRYLEREVDLAMALKNAVIQRSETGSIEGVLPQEINTFGDAVIATGAPIPVLVPIVDAARVLNLDSAEPSDGSYKASDVLPRDLHALESDALRAEEMYLAGSADTNAFYTYIHDQMSQELITLAGKSAGTEWREDQDVIRTAGFDKAVQSLSSGLPDGKQDVTVAFLVSSKTADRSIRVVGPMRTYNHKTGETNLVASSDPTALAGYAVLPPKAALKLRPPVRPGDLPMALLYSASLEADNLPTISRTLQDLFASEPSPQNAWTMEPGGAGGVQIAEWLQGVLRYAVHPSESLGPRTSAMLGLLDALGVGGRDASVAVANVVRRWVSQSQAQWRALLKAQREAVQKALDEEQPRTFQSVTGPDATVWNTLTEAETLKELIGDIRRRNPTIAEAPTLLSAALTQEAQGDAAPLAWLTIAKMDGRTNERLDEKLASGALAASRAYTLRRKALRDIELLRLRAEPEINPCEHVKQLEAIRNLSDVLQRSRMLREFIEEYQGARKGEWMTCTLCQQNAVCYHEIMELEALAQPARMDAIQKQMLIRYGGGRYEGRIICKNCGQGLQELDYDEHVEFDDEGRPITEGSVLTEEQMADTDESVWQQATKAFTGPLVTFSTVSQREISTALQTLADEAGVILTEDVMRRIVRYTDLFVSSRAPDQADYEKKRAAMMVSAATKIRTATGAGVSAAAVDVPTYAAFIDQIRVVALIAFLAIELEIANPPLVVNRSSKVGCKFERGGWPMNPAATEKDPGALQYVACVASFLEREAPWRNLAWTGIRQVKQREAKILQIVWSSACLAIIGVDPKLKKLLPFTPELRSMITKAREDTEAHVRNAMVSQKDQLPVGFRPEPFPVTMARPGLEQNPLPSVSAAVSSGAVTPGMLASVASATRQQSAAVVSELHEAARASIAALPQKPANMTDFVCCATPIRAVEAGALLGAPESASLVTARYLLRGAVPTAVNAGTHLWQDFVPAIPAPVEQSVEAGAFFKLFLKYCYTGPQVGEPHEFSAGNICRQCGLSLGKPLDLVDFGKEGAAILAAQQGDLRVEASAAAFEALSEAVRRRRILTVPAKVAAPTWMEGLRGLVTAMASSRSDAVKDVGQALGTVLDDMADERTLSEAREDEVARVTLWAPVSELADQYRNVIGERLGPLVPTVAGRLGELRAREAATALATFDAMTEDPFLEGPRAIQEYWCAKTQAIAEGFRVKEAPVTRWFKKAAKGSHVERINKIVMGNFAWYGAEAALPEEARGIIRSIGRTLGPLVHDWTSFVRPAKEEGAVWGLVEAQTVLRALVMAVWQEAVSAASWMYDEVAGDAIRDTTAGAVADWSRALMIHAKQQFVRYSGEQIRQTLQQRAEVERTAVVNEILGQADDDLRAAEFLKKTFRIGRWALGKNLRAYDVDLLDAEVEQRRAQGIVDTAIDPVLLESQVLAASMALGVPPPEDGYDVNQGAAGDDY